MNGINVSESYLPTEDEFDPLADDFIPHVMTRERTYLHFDLPLKDDDRSVSRNFLREDEPHRFLPLLGYTDRIIRLVTGVDGSPVQKTKDRPIRFASHSDAAYLQAYGEHLAPFYDRWLFKKGLHDCVLAYRKGGLTNIQHSKGLFDEIKQRKDCLVCAVDIKGFFDNLKHQHLKANLGHLLSEERLTGHNWTVFKNCTNYAWVESDELKKTVGYRRSSDGRVCSIGDFHSKVLRRSNSGLIRRHEENFGIPQGTPVSGLYANIYMMLADEKISAAVGEYGGTYRRYSDDIAVVLPLGCRVSQVVSAIEDVLTGIGLQLSKHKTEYSVFKGGQLRSRRPIQYLGFTFDGKETLIRASSLDNYRLKMRRGIHAKMVAAKQKGIAPEDIYQREARSRYTHLGRRRNFPNYAYRAAKIHESPEIRQQLKGHTRWFDAAWRRELDKVFG